MSCQDLDEPYMPPCFSRHSVFLGRCWAPPGPALQNGCCSNPGEQKWEGETDLLTLCEEMPLCLEVMGLWEWNKREKVITDNATSKSVCGINLIKGLPTQWLFFFSHKKEVLRSTLALSRKIDWITHKKITLCKGLSNKRRSVKRVSNFKQCLSLTASSLATLLLSFLEWQKWKIMWSLDRHGVLNHRFLQ